MSVCVCALHIIITCACTPSVALLCGAQLTLFSVSWEHSSHYSVCLRSTALTIQCVLGLQPDMCNSQLSHIACFDPRLCDVVPCNINCPCWNAEESPQVAHTCFSVRVLHSSGPAYSLEVCVRREYLTDPGRECARRETPPQGSGDCLPGMTS